MMYLTEEENIHNAVQSSPQTSTRCVARRLGVIQSEIWRILHVNELCPYHLQEVQHLEHKIMLHLVKQK
ncbi:hypothetical protein ANN_01460 [Periplaneta americana]|uniref:Uncharacterized protein n=1 Tax=Periplaneta americana TaxID=6978 RepID=A0ABQ8TUP4_PERAM|nr:hypothetical protein ANN_01460 [Periplaneta americana]